MTAVLLKKRQGLQSFANKIKNKKKTNKKQTKIIMCLLVAWQFPPAMGDSYPGQQSILILLGQQSRMPMREQRFLICCKEILAIETTIASANLWNSCFHQNSGDSSSPCFARTAVHLNLLGQQSRMLMSEQQLFLFYNKMLTIKIAVSSANL